MSATHTNAAAALARAAVLDASFTKVFGGLVAVNDVNSEIPAQVDRLDHRPQRRGQDDVLQHAHRPVPPDRGHDLFDGRDITACRPDIIMAAGMARTFQNIRLFATMTALENVWSASTRA